jgi:hypothetical protein
MRILLGQSDRCPSGPYRRLLPAVDELMGGGLTTMEKAHVVTYRGEKLASVGVLTHPSRSSLFRFGQSPTRG